MYECRKDGCNKNATEGYPHCETHIEDGPSGNTSIKKHSGNKYIRTIFDCVNTGETAQVDVYAVLKAFNVECPATQHALKKLLCAGIRGKGNKEQDLKEARDAISRAMQMETNGKGE